MAHSEDFKSIHTLTDIMLFWGSHKMGDSLKDGNCIYTPTKSGPLHFYSTRIQDNAAREFPFR